MGKGNIGKTIIQKDEWGPLADLLANLIAKYAEEIDFDQLPDPDYYLKIRTIKLQYALYIKYRKNKPGNYNSVEVQGEAC
ncbi:MAG: hypothetical protein K6G75_06975 [Lachnospiraceae bacterium]|nr:hypothetical protein [Lachnospiraceae bacterium]